LSTDNVTNVLTINASAGGSAASAFGIISISGQTAVIADDPGDTLTLNAGYGIILTSSATIDFITIGTDATSSNVNSALVSRDLNGGFSSSNIEVTTLTSSNISTNILTSSRINATILTSSNISTNLLTSSIANLTSINTTRITASSINVTGNISATAFISTVASGVPPFTVSSTTSVVNLNADLLDGQHASYFVNRSVGAIVYSYQNFGGAL
jgi:hypothetical protein